MLRTKLIKLILPLFQEDILSFNEISNIWTPKGEKNKKGNLRDLLSLKVKAYPDNDI